MEIYKAIILGIIEGLTEFVPVSSTGHLIITSHLIGFHGEKADSFEIFIQLGAILAVVVIYLRYFLNLLNFSKEKTANDNFAGWNGLVRLATAALPVFIVGFLLHKHIKTWLFSPFTVAIGLIGGGIIMLIIERRSARVTKEKLGDLSLKDCLLVGLFQCAALWPGVSRSGATIIGGLLCGMSRKTAAEFSFILAVPVMAVATLYDFYKSYHLLEQSDLVFFATGFVVSFIVALAAIKFFLRLLQTYTFRPFAWYRIAVGLVVLAVLRG